MKLKQKLAFVLTPIFALSSLLPLTASAATSDLLFGQQHSYTVTMRGNGEAVVLARIVFTNTGDQPQNTLSFQIPGPAAPTELVGFQQQYQTYCNSYGTPLSSGAAKSPAAAPNTSTGTIQPAILPCLVYSVPDYSQPVTNTNVNYQKLSFTSSAGNNFKVKLPTPVPAQQSSALLLSYSSRAYTHKSLGAYSFNFQTIKVNQRVSSANVAIDVDSDQVLEGKSSVNYQPVSSGASIGSQANSAAPSASSLNQISNNLGQNGEIDEQASDLAPGDTMTVKGKYASSTLLLHLPGLLATLGFLVLVGMLLFLFRRRLAAHFHRQHHPAPAHEAAGHTDHSQTELAPPTDPGKRFANAGNILAGLVSALGVCGITWFGSWYSQSTSYNNSDGFTSALIIITVLLSYILFGLGPSIYLAASNRDWRRLVFALAFEVMFLVAFVLIYALGISPLLNPPDNSGGPTTINGGTILQKSN